MNTWSISHIICIDQQCLHMMNKHLNFSCIKSLLTSKIPNFLLRVPPSTVQNARWLLPQVTMMFFSHGWNSTASTGSVELWSRTSGLRIKSVKKCDRNALATIKDVQILIYCLSGSVMKMVASYHGNTFNRYFFKQNHTNPYKSLPYIGG